MKLARDLLLLSAAAHANQQYEQAGALFAHALASDDAQELLAAIEKLENGDEASVSSVTPEVQPSNNFMSLSRIARSLSEAIQQTDEELAEDEDEVDPESESEDDVEEVPDDTGGDAKAPAPSDTADNGGEDEDDEEEVEDDEEVEEPSDIPGERLIPASISSLNSSVRVKTDSNS